MNLKYRITFYSDWHCGSGLAAGADVDALVVKDKNGLPFVPGKTIKGLVKESIETLCFLKGCNKEDIIKKTLGYFDDKEDKQQGSAFFKNAMLSEQEQNAIIFNKAQEYLYRNVSSTAIEDDGIAKEHSLRRIETVVPCDMFGEITDIPDDIVEEFKESLQLIKRLGVNRNRGLGRCKFTVMEQEDAK